MEGFFAKSPKSATSNPEELDLTLRLTPYEQNAEGKKLTRWSSSIAAADIDDKSTFPNGPHQVGPFVPPRSLYRSCSLPSRGVMRFGDLMAMRRADKFPMLSSTEVLPHSPSNVASAMKSPSEKALAVVDQFKLLPNPSGVSRRLGTGVVGSFKISYMSPRGSAEGEDSSNEWALPKLESYSIASRPADTQLEVPGKRQKLGNNGILKGNIMELLRQMPGVTTTGPNGKRIAGFLYKYWAGQVCIICLCHGNLLTPQEFVMHAGNNEVENPMKQIIVYSCPY